MKKLILPLALLVGSSAFAATENMTITSGTCYSVIGQGTIFFNQVSDKEVKIALLVGAINPVRPEANVKAQGIASFVRTRGFPSAEKETLFITLPESMQKAVKLPKFSITARMSTHHEDPQVIAYLTNPSTEDDDIEMRCQLGLSPSSTPLPAIDYSITRRSTKSSLCSIEVKEKPHLDWTLGCTGTLIGPKTILTAAHCQEAFATKPLRIRCEGDGRDLEVTKWVKNLEYRPKNHPIDQAKDISVIELKENAKAPVVAVELNVFKAKSLILAGASCTHYGYGIRADGIAGRLFEADYAFPSEPLGGRSFVEALFGMSRMLASDPTRFMRNGDSGGPIICKDANGEEKIVAVHSYLSAVSMSARSALTGYSSKFLQEWTK